MGRGEEAASADVPDGGVLLEGVLGKGGERRGLLPSVRPDGVARRSQARLDEAEDVAPLPAVRLHGEGREDKAHGGGVRDGGRFGEEAGDPVRAEDGVGDARAGVDVPGDDRDLAAGVPLAQEAVDRGRARLGLVPEVGAAEDRDAVPLGLGQFREGGFQIPRVAEEVLFDAGEEGGGSVAEILAEDDPLIRDRSPVRESHGGLVEFADLGELDLVAGEGVGGRAGKGHPRLVGLTEEEVEDRLLRRGEGEERIDKYRLAAEIRMSLQGGDEAVGQVPPVDGALLRGGMEELFVGGIDEDRVAHPADEIPGGILALAAQLFEAG